MIDHKKIQQREINKLIGRLKDIHFLEEYAKGWMKYSCSADEAIEHIINGRLSTAEACAHDIMEMKKGK